MLRLTKSPFLHGTDRQGEGREPPLDHAGVLMLLQEAPSAIGTLLLPAKPLSEWQPGDRICCTLGNSSRYLDIWGP